ncbi:hypothetical protein DY000_02045035 [Brassica cretica]|uniref:DUF4283 domain-containing protein n=1 Tax=Brassica cretica TaxID=69181 RepID=A0ABQ7F9P7_BRACR|nr:hypothetical protein DY000_02045035 [Brassica cretica]
MASKTDDELSSSKDDGLSSSISKDASLQITPSVASPPVALTPDVLSPTQDLRTQASESLEASESLSPLGAENCAGTLAGPPEKNNMKPAPESQLHGSGAEHCAGTLVGPPAMDNMVSAPTTQLFHGRDTEISTLPHGTLGTDPTMASPIQGASPSQFVPSLGSWAKPLFFKPPVTPPDPSTPKGYDPVIVGNQLAALWPSLNDEILNKQPKSKYPTRSLQLPVEKLPPPELKADGTLRFPWAAGLSPQSRNLFRAATPTYRLDGTPEISIPSKVLRLGPENKDEYVIGKFHKCSLPPGGLVHAVVNKIWGRSYNVVSSSSTSQQKEASSQVSLPAASLTCGVLNIQNQFKDLDVLPAASVSEVTIITKDVSRSHSGLETETQSLYVSSNTSMDCQDTQVAGYKTISSSSQIQEENQIALPSLPKIFSPLVDSQSAPTSTHIMDSCPSKIISSEDHKFSVVDLLTTTLLASAFESPSRFTMLGNVDETDVEPMGSLGLTRGGRETKPPIKYQDLEWKTPHGRGKHGRRGCRSNH